jgi:MoxR-like ATPase
MNSMALERERENEGMLIALLSGTSCFLLGEPGTGKTFQIRLMGHLFGLNVFDTLLSESSKPESIFGPPDIPALAKGTQRTKIKGYAPTADVLFFDEMFKASGVVLNPLLWLINEKQYRNGDEGIIKCPTRVVLVASNEVPTDPALAPIYDRLLIRYIVRPMRARENMHRMIDVEEDLDTIKPMMTRSELDKCVAQARTVEVPAEIRDCVFSLRDQVNGATGVPISDRRLRKCFRILQARAFLYGRREVELKDVEVLSHVLWSDPGHARKVRNLVTSVSNAKLADLLAYTEVAEEVWQRVSKTGDVEAGMERMTDMLRTVKKYSTEAGRQVAQTIREYIDRLSNLKDNRQMVNVIEVVAADGSRWFKLSSACETFWTAQQIRQMGFHWSRTSSYWWQDGPGSRANAARRKKFRDGLAARVFKAFKVKVTFSKMG